MEQSEHDEQGVFVDEGLQSFFACNPQPRRMMFVEDLKPLNLNLKQEVQGKVGLEFRP